ncbi:Os06g0127250 [Oryza sativa Japonica Group]|uniref:Os06g0127250 protein n=1 Tax=Oryza sativa subsp. japonica TaxID=39947 RepID=A0A0P0WRP3_ORYSJ|nr:Os06g0127250 [Oryza sativa Japonica Group]
MVNCTDKQNASTPAKPGASASSTGWCRTPTVSPTRRPPHPGARARRRRWCGSSCCSCRWRATGSPLRRPSGPPLSSEPRTRRGPPPSRRSELSRPRRHHQATTQARRVLGRRRRRSSAWKRPGTGTRRCRVRRRHRRRTPRARTTEHSQRQMQRTMICRRMWGSTLLQTCFGRRPGHRC